MEVVDIKSNSMKLSREAFLHGAGGPAVAILRRNGADAIGNGHGVNWAAVEIQLNALLRSLDCCEDHEPLEPVSEDDNDEIDDAYEATLEIDDFAMEFESFEN